jgi:uncharacterized protein (TIGR03067 family)
MFRMLFHVTLAVVVGICFDTGTKAKPGLDPANLIGSWKLVAATHDGEVIDQKEPLSDITISKDKLKINTGDVLGVLTLSYKLNCNSNPATIDMVLEQEHPRIEFNGIIAPMGNGFKLCGVLNQEGGRVASRPKKFESTKDNQAILIEIRPNKRQ